MIMDCRKELCLTAKASIKEVLNKRNAQIRNIFSKV
jgi:hypothetical protein